MVTLAANQVIGGNWRVVRFLGEGACAKVYEVVPTNKLNDNLGYELVAKVIPLPGHQGKKANKKEQERICNTLSYEYTLYTGLLYGFPCAARNPLRFYGDDPALHVRYLVMERMERDLVDFAKASSPSPAQVADIGLQILEGLQWLHGKTFVFVDVKPDNFMLKGDKVYFVDFGLVERVMENSPAGAVFNGTPTFSSVSADKGNPMTYRDDVEALGYVLLSLFTEGKLPWSTTNSLQALHRMKETTDIAAVCAQYDVPELAEMINHCRGLTGKARPNYTLITSWLQTMRGRKSKSRTSSAPPPVAAEKAASKASKASETTTKKRSKTDAEKGEQVKEEQVQTEAVAKKPATRKTKKTQSQSATEPIEEIKIKDIQLEKDEIQSPVDPAPVAVAVAVPRKRKTVRVVEEPQTIQSPVRVTRSSATAAAASAEKQSIASPLPAEDHVFAFESTEDPSLLAMDFSQRRAYRRSSMGLSEGPFSSHSTLPAKPSSKAPSSTVKVRIVPQTGRQFIHDFPCPKDTREVVYTIGKDSHCDFALGFDNDISSKHMKLRITADDVSVLDDGSENGTMINGLTIPRRRWKSVQLGYTVITIGSTKLEFL